MNNGGYIIEMIIDMLIMIALAILILDIFFPQLFFYKRGLGSKYCAVREVFFPLVIICLWSNLSLNIWVDLIIYGPIIPSAVLIATLVMAGTSCGGVVLYWLWQLIKETRVFKERWA